MQTDDTGNKGKQQGFNLNIRHQLGEHYSNYELKINVRIGVI